jgi:hypothetical protein
LAVVQLLLPAVSNPVAAVERQEPLAKVAKAVLAETAAAAAAAVNSAAAVDTMPAVVVDLALPMQPAPQTRPTLKDSAPEMVRL